MEVVSGNVKPARGAPKLWSLRSGHQRRLPREIVAPKTLAKSLFEFLFGERKSVAVSQDLLGDPSMPFLHPIPWSCQNYKYWLAVRGPSPVDRCAGLRAGASRSRGSAMTLGIGV